MAIETLPRTSPSGNVAYSDLRDWLREHLYSLGAKFTPQETIERVTGSRIDAKPYLRYLREKLAPQVA